MSMAKIITQAVPPSLAADYGALFTVPSAGKIRSGQVNVKSQVRLSEDRSNSDPFLLSVKQAADWLVENWSPQNSSSFYADRRSEILAHNFDPLFWYELTAINDRTECGVPAVGISNDIQKPAYVDPLRLPSKNTYELWSSFYPTPAGLGTELQPSPGWQGAVIDGVYRDLWFAQRRLFFNLPVLVSYNVYRPVLCLLSGTVTADTNFRGNSAWFARCLWPAFFQSQYAYLGEVNYLVSIWNAIDKVPIELPAETSNNWHFEHNAVVLRDISLIPPCPHRKNCNRLNLVVSTPPARGRYFARNDAIRVSHAETVQIFVGRTPFG